MKAPIPSHAVWAKLRPRRGDPEEWHSLADHSADVAACAEALLAVPLIRQRLAELAGVNAFPDVWADRLAALAYLHDFGKANVAFQDRARGAGHIREAVYIAAQTTKRKEAGLDALDVFGPPTEFLLALALGHHGEPPEFNDPNRSYLAWSPSQQRDPVQDIRLLVIGAASIWPEAFDGGGPALPGTQSSFWHAYLGLLQLADWLGSDEAADAFPFSDADQGWRLDFARARARSLVQRIGFDAARLRANLPRHLAFNAVSLHTPTEIQLAVAEAPGPVVVLEAETGSGKTEAALWRFASLFSAGKVDGLYFALPTRVAATQMHKRVQASIDTLFPNVGLEVVRALPGDAMAGSAAVRTLPEFDAQWSDDPDEVARRSRWAAERPKRFLAAPIAVGTIDQALLGAVRVKHAQMRCFCLSRSLLVIDEVHASDTYMEKLLVNLLEQHCNGGGEALLLSATLGAPARTRLLLRSPRKAKKATPQPNEAAAAAYPAVSWVDGERIAMAGKASRGTTKTVAVEPVIAIADPNAAARMALVAAQRGGKVLVVRNTVRDAVAAARALHAIAPDDSVLFRLDGIATLHHGRFARSDRRRLDEAVERGFGKVRMDGGVVLIGTQTLEQSLDIDADLLVTDLAPIDVLLQRIGRLHRHERPRPPAFASPRAIVLTPADFNASLATVGRERMSGPHGIGTVYENLVSLAATKERIGAGAAWTIPAMNRQLVEAATHPEELEAVADRLAETDERWRTAWERSLGKKSALGQAANAAMILWSDPVSNFRVAEERIGTRTRPGRHRGRVRPAGAQPVSGL